MAGAVDWLKDKAAGALVSKATNWLWGTAGAMITGLSQWATGHPNQAALLISGVIVLLFVVGAVFVARQEPREKVAHPKTKPSQPSFVYSHEQVLSLEPATLEQRDLNSLRNEFEQLTWIQQAALALLCQNTSLPATAFRQIMEHRGFGADNNDTLAQLRKTRLVEVSHTGQFSPHPARLPQIRHLIEEWKHRVI